jgi:anti-sigma B factor antagonist
MPGKGVAPVQVSSRQSAVGRPWLGLEVIGAPPHASVRVTGELDMVTAPDLERTLNRLCSAGYRDVDLDVSGLTFVGAAGLTVFVRCDERLRAVAGLLRLIAPTRRCRRLLAITGLDATLTVD